jgi:hypothetical protein
MEPPPFVGMQPDSLDDEHGRRPRIWMALLFLALIAVASATLYQLWTLRSEPRWAAVHFDARRDGDKLLLTWDPNAPAVIQAERGALLVNDGQHPVSIPLSPEQLVSGSLSYPVPSGNVLFRLHLYDKGRSVATDALRVITGENAAETRPTDQTPTDTKTAGAKATPTPPPPDNKSAEAKTSPTPTPAVPGASSPVVRREVQPVIPPGIRTRITSPVVVRVVVTIDDGGRVTHAFSAEPGSGLERYLSDEAVRAARQWLFSPARSKDGTPVVATKSISFEFLPERK